MADEIILCTSELAANAALHSRSSLPGGTLTVRASIHPGRQVQIEVDDDGGPWFAGTRGSIGHHGLDIVRALATDWGIDGDHTTRTICARFDWPGRS
jgi:anti-sigma regulatory factor (Ser/Thr protein kinase)